MMRAIRSSQLSEIPDLVSINIVRIGISLRGTVVRLNANQILNCNGRYYASTPTVLRLKLETIRRSWLVPLWDSQSPVKGHE
jgi:hypothetical protein